MPFLVYWNGFQRYTTPEQAKLQVAAYWRQHNKVRDADAIDAFVRGGYERLYSIQDGSIWGATILDQLAPVTNARGNVTHN